MALTLNELKERIVQEAIDPCTMCEILDITTEELLHEFEDKLIDKRKLYLSYISIAYNGRILIVETRY
jgi:hypothetical protein